MRHGFALILVGCAQLMLAAASFPFGLLLVWSGLSWIVAGLTYGMIDVNVFGKRADGTLAPANCILLLPYLLPAWTLWHAQRILSREDVNNEIIDGIWLGRRCSARRLPPHIDIVVDMTCEFREAQGVTNERRYICLPTPDGAAPSLSRLVEAVDAISSCGRGVYVHCAVGHGRSAMFVAALLLKRGMASTVDEAEALIRAKRPQVRLNSIQRRRLQEFIASSPPIL